MKRLDLVIPCYNEAAVLPLFYREVTAVLQDLWEYDCRLFFVDDGSGDDTLTTLQALAASDTRVKYLSFSRNFGKEAAMLAGLRATSAELVGILDADLQHSPKLLRPMLDALGEGYDVAAAKRTDRSGEGKLKSRLSDRFYEIANRLTDVEIDPGAQDFRVMRRSVVDAILSMPEHHRFTKGIFSFVGFRTKWFAHENAERAAGETKWNLRKLLSYAMDGIIGYSDKLLKLPLLFGCLVCVGSVIALLVQLVLQLFTGVQVAAVHPLAALACLIAGLLLLSIGVLGLYVARVYAEVKNRPMYIVRESNCDEK